MKSTAKLECVRGLQPNLGRRRAWLVGLACVVASCLLVGRVWAGSYLNRAALLVFQASQEADYLRTRLGDRELARVVHEVAEARLRAAGRMEVPKEVALAHPHLLLTLENSERAMEAAAEGEHGRFLVHVRRAREEELVLRSVLKQLGWPLPNL